MGILLTATGLLVAACFAFGSEIDIVMESDPWTEKDIAPHMSQAEEKLFYPNPCTSKVTCRDCIRAHPDCGWCISQIMDYRDYRRDKCNYKEVVSRGCKPGYAFTPINKADRINDRLWNLFLRPKGSMSFDFTASVNEDVPLQMYTVANVPDNVQVTYRIQSGYDPVERKNFYAYAKKGDHVRVKISFQLLSCPRNRSQYKHTMQIIGAYPTDSEYWHDVAKVNLHMICECGELVP